MSFLKNAEVLPVHFKKGNNKRLHRLVQILRVHIHENLKFYSMEHLESCPVKTPNWDRLASRAVLFTHACNMGSFTPPVCVASRAMLNTGWTGSRSRYRSRPLNHHFLRQQPYHRGTLVTLVPISPHRGDLERHLVDLFQVGGFVNKIGACDI